MAIKNSTKQAFAQALKSLLVTKELSAIRVQELCRLCGTERPTFYYHFRDKYDLVSWIYEQDMLESMGGFGGRYSEAQIEMLLLRLAEEQTFYRRAFNDSGQNALLPYILQSNIRMAKQLLQNDHILENLTQEDEFHIHMYTYAWCGCLQDWVSGRYDFSAARYAQLMFNSLIRMDETSLGRKWKGEQQWDTSR